MQASEDRSELETSRGLIEEVVLGKVSVMQGTEISKNDCGIRLQNCECFIDDRYTTRIFDNH